MTLKTTRRGALRRSLSAVGAVSAAALVLAGCSGGGDGDSGDVTELTFWLSASAEQQAGYDALVKDYKADTGIDVKIVNVPYDGFVQKVREAAQANALPDVASVPALDPIWTNNVVDLSAIVNDEANSINQDLIAYKDGDKVLAIPSDVTSSGLFINTTLFDEAGVDYPTEPENTWTWDEFLDAANTVREATGAKYSLTFDPSPSRLRAMVYELGGKYIHADEDGVFSSDDATKEALEMFVEMNDDKVMPKSVWTSGQDPSALFQSGQVVAYWSGVWQVASFADNITSFDWASVPSPAQPVQAADVNTGGLVVGFKNSDARSQAASDFIAWTFEPENYKKLAEINGYLSVETDVTPEYPFESQKALDAFELYNKSMALYDPISGYFNRAQAAWVLDGKTLTTDPSVTELGKAINGQQDVETTLQNIVDGYNEQVGK